MGCETTHIIEDNASANSTPNQEDEEKFKDFDEIGSKY